MDVLARVNAAGVRLLADGDRLVAWPKAALTPEIRHTIRKHKDELINLLRYGRRPPQPVAVTTKPTTTESTYTGAECMGCRYLVMKVERHAGTRRTFWWRCGKGHELLESRHYGERVLTAPADCQSFERWQAGEP